MHTSLFVIAPAILFSNFSVKLSLLWHFTPVWVRVRSSKLLVRQYLETEGLPN